MVKKIKKQIKFLINKINKILIKSFLKQSLAKLTLYMFISVLIVNYMGVYIYNNYIIKNEIKNDKIISIKDKINKNSKIYLIYEKEKYIADIYIKNKNKDYMYLNLPLRTVDYYEKYIFKKNIKYFWTTKIKLEKS